MNQEEIRKQFEDWKNTQGYMGSVYRDERAEIAWDAWRFAWQAALASKQEHTENDQDAGLKAMLEYSRETGNAFIYQPKAIEPSQVSMPKEIVFGSGKIGVHTEIMSDRKAIWLSTLGSGIVDAPTKHPDATSLAPEHVLSVMVFNSKESCKVLIDALTDLYPTCPMKKQLNRKEN